MRGRECFHVSGERGVPAGAAGAYPEVLLDGGVYTFGYEDIVKGSGYISTQCCGSAEIEGMPNGREVLSISPQNDIGTYWDVLFFAGPVLGGFFYCERVADQAAADR